MGAANPLIEELGQNSQGYAVSLSNAETKDYEPLISLAELASRRGTPKAAWRLYSRALKKKRRGGGVAAASADLETAVRIAPDLLQAHAALALLMLRTGDIDKADEHAEIVRALAPDYLPGQEIQALVHYARGQFRQAADGLRPIVKEAPNRKSAHFILGYALLKLGENQAAARHLETADLLLHDPPRSPRPRILQALSRGRSAWRQRPRLPFR